MTYETLQAFCEALPSATAQIKIDNHLTYNIGGKSFIWLSLDHEPATCSFKCTEEDFATLSERDGFRPAPYMARYKWIHCDDIAMLEEEDLENYIKSSYQIIRAKLPKKIRENL